jgi:hypothetical protein
MLLPKPSLNREEIFMNANFYTRFLAAPPELKVFAIFSVVVTILGFALPVFGSKNLWEAIVPFTGWSPGLGYML